MVNEALCTAINRDYRRDESSCLKAVWERVRLTSPDAERVRTQALSLAQAAGSETQSGGGGDRWECAVAGG